MKKKIVITLSIIAVIFYARALWVIMGSPSVDTSNVKGQEDSFVNKVIVTKECAFTTVKQSPFGETKKRPKPKPKIEPVKKEEPKPKVEVKAPNIKINGIMWDPKKPIAMVKLPNGSTQMVKAGDEILGRIKVKRVEKTRMQILYKETLFWIER